MSKKLESREDLKAYLKEKYPNNPEMWEERYCSFCGMGATKAKGVVAGPNGVLICNACVLLAKEALEQSGRL